MRSLMSLLFCWLAALPAVAAPVAQGNSAGMMYQIEEIASGFEIPWGMAFVDADTLLVTERRGQLWLVKIESGHRQQVSGVATVWANGQGGLLDVAVEPDYTSDRWIYFTYSKPVQGRGATTLARAQLNGDQLRNWEDLLVTRSTTGTSRHFGSRIAFDDAGYVYFGVGDRGERPNGQDLTTHAGSILRLHRDGQVPEDNPFRGRSDVLAEIWSYGHRNPQGLAYDHRRQQLWEIEHGPRGGDEINLIRRGGNYGWPVISYGQEYWGPFDVGEGTHRDGMEQPVKYYTPSIAPGSLLVYHGNAFPAWRGDLFSGALKLTHLNRVTLNDKGEAVAEERLLESLNERIRALAESPEGWLYLSTDSGRILRVRPQ
ncbi:PQQ-dependent sugar dehydrogenase [Motiliproteus sediminis]|uniref:PQQ-dependent sugar dehydrogenase n=1 Tax=Motiliproteus sediminis TaxID=1468178 RepID=UPI001AF0187D|nr:PQQ-dependent sugar dehydrogenase [Motiliproteus sediminis]